MGYEVIASRCDEGDCPTIHIDRERGTVAIQGYVVQDTALQTPEGETVVEMPIEVFTQLTEQLFDRTATKEEEVHA